jgi:hypothetical protein
VAKTHKSTILTANVLKRELGLEFTVEDKEVEQAYRGGNGTKRH